jgi:iron complex outermembrane receptor protein
MPLTPKLKAGLSAEYQDGAFWGRLKAKATSKQQATLVNDESAPGYTVFDFDAGYTFANYGILKRPKLSFNLSNIFSKEYRNPSSQAITNTSAFPGVTAGTLRYYLGALRVGDPVGRYLNDRPPVRRGECGGGQGKVHNSTGLRACFYVRSRKY